MSINELSKQDHAREIRHLPVDHLHNVGTVSSGSHSPVEKVFESESPFKLNEEDFSDDECDCGGTYDEYDRCSDCDNGHSDCEIQECFPCMERAISRAEDMYD